MRSFSTQFKPRSQKSNAQESLDVSARSGRSIIIAKSTPSPQITVAEPEAVVVALYIRDAYQLPVEKEIPLLHPRVNVETRPTWLR